MSLFLKIFLWFWLATALVGGTLFFVTWATRGEPAVKMWRESAERNMTVYAESAAEIYQAKGKSGLDSLISKVSEKVNLNVVVLDQNGTQIESAGILQDTQNVINEALTNAGETEFDSGEDFALVAKRAKLANGNTLVIVAEFPRYKPVSIWNDARANSLRILAVILMAGLVCYGMARYFAAPIGKLRSVVKSFAGGNLQTRTEKISKRRDEIGSLARDFDEMAERIENLISAQKRLTTDVSHELRSPLARLNVALELARAKSNPETKPILDRIERESLRLNEMISNILTLSKLENRTEDIEKSRVNLSRIVREISADANFEAQAKQKSVNLIAEKDFYVHGNETLLRSAIENVVRNAMKYTNERVEISLKQIKEMVCIAVRDFGKGVSHDELSNLFRPFYRIGEARERNSGGVGLGLAIAERAVHAHAGEIRAENAKEGGLIVEIKLLESKNV